MSTAIFPLVFASAEARLLTGIVLGFLFGFSLERAGFGNARKLAGQFYLYDMTVFKVMFTAILVSMVGFYTLASLGYVDLSRMWINPTFMWAQAVGGFLLGVGFIMSGLCPGTSVVSAASGRWDGLVTFIGIFIGVGLFTLAVDTLPGLASLYTSGSLGVTILPQLLGLPAPLVGLAVVVVAVACFVGAEAIERKFRDRHPTVPLTPAPRPRIKFALAGTFALVTVIGVTATRPQPQLEPLPMQALEPLQLAEAIIRGDPHLLILDLRPTAEPEARVPGAIRVAPDSTALATLASAGEGAVVVVYDENGLLDQAPSSWPRTLEYRYVRDGLVGWRADVLTPLEIDSYDSERLSFIRRQNQISAFFSGAAVQTSTVEAPPPAMPAAGAGAKKKRAGGC